MRLPNALQCRVPSLPSQVGRERTTRTRLGFSGTTGWIPPSSREIQVALDKMKRGNTGGPALSETIMELLKESWSLGSLDYGARRDPDRFHRPRIRAA